MAVDDIVKKMQDAWNAGDSEKYAAVFSKDATFVDMLGRVQKGREVIAAEHQKFFDTIFRDSRRTITVTGSRALGDDVELVYTTSQVEVPSGPRAGVTPSIQTMVVTNDEVIAFHNTVRSDVADFARDDQELAALSPLDWRRT